MLTVKAISIGYTKTKQKKKTRFYETTMDEMIDCFDKTWHSKLHNLYMKIYG